MAKGVNGAAAHHCRPGDMVILANFGFMSDAEARRHEPRVVRVDADNAGSATGAVDLLFNFNGTIASQINILDYLVVFSDSPIDDGALVSIDENYYNIGSYISLFPNP